MLRSNKSVVKSLLLFIILPAFLISCKDDQSQQPQPKPEPTATVTFVIGNVTAAYPGASAVNLNVNDKLKIGAVIESKAKSYATLQINEVGLVRINENSKLEISDILSSENGTELNLKLGTAFSRVLKKPGTNYRMKTMTMVASVRGTEFLTIAGKRRDQVLVREGTVNVSTATDPEGKPVTERKRADVDSKGDIKLAFQNRLQELTVEKYALHPYIENIESKSAEEIEQEIKSSEPEEKKIDKKIEEVKIMMLSPLDRLRKEGKPLVKLSLKDGSEIMGSIDKTTESDISLNTGESIISIPKSDIRRRVSVK